MTKTAWMLALAIASLLGACSEDKEPCELTGNDRKFGDCCTEDSQCASGVCHEFGDGTEACTLSCSTSADCPSGSQGQKCNNQKVCRT